jgi:hypothetical protein
MKTSWSRLATWHNQSEKLEQALLRIMHQHLRSMIENLSFIAKSVNRVVNCPVWSGNSPINAVNDVEKHQLPR